VLPNEIMQLRVANISIRNIVNVVTICLSVRKALLIFPFSFIELGGDKKQKTKQD
jgi:hypothetical protein